MTEEKVGSPLPDLHADTLADVSEMLDAAGLKRLSPVWAKAEIVLGLAAAAAGIKLLTGTGLEAWGGGALFVLGLYLAMAGHRSHLYQSLNLQTAIILRQLRARDDINRR